MQIADLRQEGNMNKSYRIVDTMTLDQIRNKPCLVCARMPSDPHHVKSRKSGGHDEEHNLAPLCRICHTEIHKLGLTTFAEKYASFKDWLLANGWEINFLNKWQHAGNEE